MTSKGRLSVVFFMSAVILLSATGVLAQNAADPMVTGQKANDARVKDYLIRAAEKMPEEDYSFKPTPEVKSFGQMLGHIADSQYFFAAAILGGLAGDLRRGEQVDDAGFYLRVARGLPEDFRRGRRGPEIDGVAKHEVPEDPFGFRIGLRQSAEREECTPSFITMGMVDLAADLDEEGEDEGDRPVQNLLARGRAEGSGRAPGRARFRRGRKRPCQRRH